MLKAIFIKFQNFKFNVFIIILLVVSGCKQPKRNVIRIAAAANMQYAIEEISNAFTEKTGVSCELVVSSSGKLTAQIIEGAPYDIFVSANMKYPNEIYKNELALEAPKVYAYGQLVLWSMYQEMEPSLEMLTNDTIVHIAIANPKTAPYGQAAIELLKKSNVYDLVEEKLVYGESISQTNQFITSKSSEIGFTAMSVVLSAKMKDKGGWILLNKKEYTPIEQGAVIIKRENQDSTNSRKFYKFLFSKEAREILEDFGYLVAE
ncbi:molybdate transport system substrate-binding protein [Aquimarina amphilecti]|uniref:Molybdate transport system substrate-binding protein n=1 Tax=Aquimarina amphilecti TaxID=1038014 RepID=A0A1H7SGL7_AQUAM|nr:molybdate ABC transporter substrate-binding protein [Aquimarina amphilecti]SEL71841.1 molybdate transport system substrate-binding protein [Aquimarina amphilecti]